MKVLSQKYKRPFVWASSQTDEKHISVMENNAFVENNRKKEVTICVNVPFVLRRDAKAANRYNELWPI